MKMNMTSKMINMYEIGVDEAGRGPMIGPLVVAAIAIPEQDIELLKKYEITDSKKLSTKKRNLAYEKINSLCLERNWKIEITICHPIEIDFAMESTNLNTLETELFANTVNKLKIINTKKGKLILDACDVNENRFGNRVINLIKKWDQGKWTLVSKHRADETHRIVGAASIIAKVTRDRIITEIGKKLDIEIGSGYPSDPKSKSALFELCKGDLPDENLRWNWASIRKHWIKTKGSSPPIRNYNKSNTKIFRQSRLTDY